MQQEIERYGRGAELGGEVIEGELECGHYHRAHEGCRGAASCGDYHCCH